MLISFQFNRRPDANDLRAIGEKLRAHNKTRSHTTFTGPTKYLEGVALAAVGKDGNPVDMESCVSCAREFCDINGLVIEEVDHCR